MKTHAHWHTRALAQNNTSAWEEIVYDVTIHLTYFLRSS